MSLICGGICNFNEPCGECERCVLARTMIEGTHAGEVTDER